MINSVRNSVLAIANKHNFGYIAPSDFNLYAKVAQMEIFEDLFWRYSTMYLNQAKRLSGSDFADNVQNVLEDIEVFLETEVFNNVSANNYTIPDNCYFLDVLLYNGVEADKVSYGKALKLLSSHHTAPSATCPIYTKTGGVVAVYPTTRFTIIGNYVRYPLDPKWTYQGLSGGEPVFDQSASDYQDFELPASYMPELVRKICLYAGVEIREGDLAQFAKTEEIESEQKKG